MAGILHLTRGLNILVPRDMTRAVAFYNTLLQQDEPALIVEVLNGYRLKERVPDNLATMTLALGEPETLREGEDVTLVTYGACCRVALEAAEQLAKVGVECTVIDVQTLAPFDVKHTIVQSVQKTNRLVVLDEDVPGGASAFIMQTILETQNGYRWLDSAPLTITATASRPAYGHDGDYFSKPSAETVTQAVYELMNEAHPAR